MSDIYFYNKFSTALVDILEQYQQELFPDNLNAKNQKISIEWSCKDWLNFYVALYVKYINVLKRVEDCYDQTTHPQMRQVIKKFLNNILARVVQIKKSLIFYNNPIIEVSTGIPYIFLDDYIIEMKLEPDDLNLPVPRYFAEDTPELANRKLLIDQRLIEKNGNALPEEDITKFFFSVNLNMEDAVKVLQNFEMGRQNLKRISKALKLAQKKIETDMGGDKKILMEDERKKLVYDHLISLYKVRKTREEEQKFLKMLPNDSHDKEEQYGVKIAEETRKNRKIIQREKQEEYDKYKKDLSKNIQLIEGYEIYQDMMNQRKDWIEKEKHVNKGVPPLNVQEFYKRNDVEKREELDEQQKKVAETIAKDKLKKEQDKKKKEESGTKIVRKFFKIFNIPSAHP
jgi:hypothetical protein